MVMFTLYFTKDALKDAKKIAKSSLQTKVDNLLTILEKNPFQDPPPVKKLVGKLFGTYSRRINLQHRLLYEVDTINKRVKILRMWSHYGDN
jgi:toxin YoeB